MTDWPALAARFEAATDDDIYECVSMLLVGVEDATDGGFGSRFRELNMFSIQAQGSDLPDLLLGVVVACVPEGWGIAQFRDLGPMGGVDRSACSLYRPNVPFVRAEAGSRPAALGAAVCRAWESVGKGEVE